MSYFEQCANTIEPTAIDMKTKCMPAYMIKLCRKDICVSIARRMSVAHPPPKPHSEAISIRQTRYSPNELPAATIPVASPRLRLNHCDGYASTNGKQNPVANPCKTPFDRELAMRVQPDPRHHSPGSKRIARAWCSRLRPVVARLNTPMHKQ